MDRDSNAINQCGRLRWLLTAVLVLGLISFAGSLSESGSAGIQRPKTELRAAGRLNPAKTVDFTNACAGLAARLLHVSARTWDFTSCLLEFGITVKVKTKCSIRVLTTIRLQFRLFVKYYSYANSGDSDLERITG
jgi:hypothetical protein